MPETDKPQATVPRDEFDEKTLGEWHALANGVGPIPTRWLIDALRATRQELADAQTRMEEDLLDCHKANRGYKARIAELEQQLAEAKTRA